MDDKRFDELTKSVSSVVGSRRLALRAALTGVATSLGVLGDLDLASAKHKKNNNGKNKNNKKTKRKRQKKFVTARTTMNLTAKPRSSILRKPRSTCKITRTTTRVTATIVTIQTTSATSTGQANAVRTSAVWTRRVARVASAPSLAESVADNAIPAATARRYPRSVAAWGLAVGRTMSVVARPNNLLAIAAQAAWNVATRQAGAVRRPMEPQ